MNSKPWYEKLPEWSAAICDKSVELPTREAIFGETPTGGMAINHHTAAFLAATEIFLAEHTGDSMHLERAYRCLQVPSATGGFPATATWEGVTALRKVGMLTDADEERMCREFTAEARGAARGHFTRLPGFRIFNHAVTSANLCDAVARLWPDSPDADELMAAADEVWNEWWVLGENIEGAPNYEGFNNAHLLQWAERRGELDMALNHPGTRFWMARGPEHILPNGFIPGFGDTNNCEIWSQWVGLLALQASWAGDARALRAAEKVFAWNESRGWLETNLTLVERCEGQPFKANVGWWQVAWVAYNLAFAYRALKNLPAGLEPEEPTWLPTVTHRQLPSHDLIRHETWSLVPPKYGARVPDQTVLRFGPEDTCHATSLSCGRQLWHDHMDSGAIVSYAADGVVLLDDNGYDSKLPIDHNLFLSAKPGEDWLAYSPQDWPRRRAKVASFGQFDFQVRGLTGREVAQVVVTECNVPFEMPFRQERTVLLARRGQMVVYDRILPFSQGLIGSPLWHVQTVHDSGPGWVEGSVDLFMGRQGVCVKNAPGTVLIVDPFNSDPWGVYDQDKVDHHAPADAIPAVRENHELVDAAHVSRMCVSRPVPLEADAIERFVTVLMPRDRVSDPGSAAKVLSRAADGIFALDVAGDTFVVNESTEITSDCWGSTDAETLWRDADGVFAHRVRNIMMDGISLHTGEHWLDVDISWNEEGIGGHIASEKPAVVTLSRNGTERKLNVFGITPVNEAF